jgi:hypothetical protein
LVDEFNDRQLEGEVKELQTSAGKAEGRKRTCGVDRGIKKIQGKRKTIILMVVVMMLDNARIKSLPNDAYYIPDFITESEEEWLLQKVSYTVSRLVFLSLDHSMSVSTHFFFFKFSSHIVTA